MGVADDIAGVRLRGNVAPEVIENGKTIKTFRNADDPIREILGPGKESHPEEWNRMIKELEDKGVEIRYREGVIRPGGETMPSNRPTESSADFVKGLSEAEIERFSREMADLIQVWVDEIKPYEAGWDKGEAFVREQVEYVEASKVLFIDDDPQTQELRENQEKLLAALRSEIDSPKNNILRSYIADKKKDLKEALLLDQPYQAMALYRIAQKGSCRQKEEVSSYYENLIIEIRDYNAKLFPKVYWGPR